MVLRGWLFGKKNYLTSWCSYALCAFGLQLRV
jgi:hypothetical protein